MLTSIACPGSVSSWVAFAASLSAWMVQPLVILPGLVLLFLLVSLIPALRRRRFLRTGTIALNLIYLLIIFPPTIRGAETLLAHAIPQDSGITVDAVVILGRGAPLNPSRAKAAAALWQEHRAPLIFASGISDAPKLIRLLEKRGIPPASLQGEECSRTTYENAQYTAALLQPQGVRNILLVTDAPHMLRSLLTFRSFGFRVIPAISSSLEKLNPQNRAKLVLREYMGLVSYGLLGRFSSSHPAKARFVVPESLEFSQMEQPQVRQSLKS